MNRLERMRRTWTRDRRNGWVGGVCAGLARTLNVNPALIRVVWVVAAVFTWKVAAAAYVVAWILMPAHADEPDR